MQNLYNYVFHYNDHTELWYAIPRDFYIKYWNNPNHPSILKSQYINALINSIIKEEKTTV